MIKSETFLTYREPRCRKAAAADKARIGKAKTAAGVDK